MIVVLGDTHRDEDHGLTDDLRSRVRDAAAVVHTGDFVTGAVVDAFEAEAGGDVVGVHGNADSAAVRDRLPARRTVTVDGRRLAIVHGDEHSQTSLSLFGRAEGADLVVAGHSHRPAVIDGPVTLCNPGSHTRPRNSPPTYALLDGSSGLVLTTAGTVVTEFGLP